MSKSKLDEKFEAWLEAMEAVVASGGRPEAVLQIETANGTASITVRELRRLWSEFAMVRANFAASEAVLRELQGVGRTAEQWKAKAASLESQLMGSIADAHREHGRAEAFLVALKLAQGAKS